MLAINSQAANAPRAQTRSSVAYNLAGIAVLALLMAVGAAYLIDELGRSTHAHQPSLTDTDLVSQTISGQELSIPRAWFRFGEQIRSGFTNQIDLRILFAPAGIEAQTVDVSLLPRSRARTSASLLDRVYLHQFGTTTLDGVPDLVGKPMLADNGYAGESVWYDALSPNPFVAKCMAPVAADGRTQCVRTVYLPSGIAAVYTFDAAALQHWRDFDPQMQQWLSRIGAW